MVWKLDGAEVPTNKGFVYTEDDGNIYTSPKNWHMAWDDAQKKKVGLVHEAPATPSDADKLNALRLIRSALIAQTDYYGLSDVTMSDEMKTYRQKLRDITKTYKMLKK